MSDTVLVALIGAAALLVSTWMQRGTRKDAKAAKEGAEKAVEQTKNTSNGFAERVTSRLDDIAEALEDETRARRLRDRQQNQLIVKFDDRLIAIEEKL